jgi:hypothetical protein
VSIIIPKRVKIRRTDESQKRVKKMKTDESQKRVKIRKTDESQKRVKKMKTDESQKRVKIRRTDESQKRVKKMKTDESQKRHKIMKIDESQALIARAEGEMENKADEHPLIARAKGEMENKAESYKLPSSFLRIQDSKLNTKTRIIKDEFTYIVMQIPEHGDSLISVSLEVYTGDSELEADRVGILYALLADRNKTINKFHQICGSK